MKKEDIIKEEISYRNSEGLYTIDCDKLAKFLAKHVEIKPEDLIESHETKSS